MNDINAVEPKALNQRPTFKAQSSVVELGFG